MNTNKTSDEAKQRAANYMSLKGALEPKLTIITTDIAGVVTVHASNGELKASAHAPTIKEAQIKAVGNLLNLMAEAKGIEGVIICSQRAKLDMVKPKNTKANVYIAKLLNTTTHNVNKTNG
jgi:hypothetical protein